MKVKMCALIKPLSCRKGTGIVEAAKILMENKQRRLIVVDEKDYPVGILSTTDISNKVVAGGKTPGKLKVDEVMTSPLYLVCDIEDDLAAIYRKMVEHESFFVPALKEGKLYGILTYGELVERAKELIKNGRP